MKCKGGWRVGTCIARKLQRVARNSDATRDVKEGKKGKVQRADKFPLNLLYQCLALLHSSPLLLLLWVPSFGGNPLTTAIGLLGLITTSAGHTHRRRTCTFVPTSMSIELWD